MRYEDYKVDVPEGRSGRWYVKRFTVSKEEEAKSAMRAAVTFSGRFTPTGSYTALYCGAELVMSDTPDEIRDHFEPITRANAHCLVAGLGLGMVAQAMLQKAAVTCVTVVEKSPDVIKLVAPTLKKRFGDRVAIIRADVLNWKPPRGHRYGVAWFDIWHNISEDNLPEMRLLERRFTRRAKWRGSWSRDLLL